MYYPFRTSSGSLILFFLWIVRRYALFLHFSMRTEFNLNLIPLIFPLLPSGGFEDVVIDGTTAFCTDIEKPAMLLSSQTIISCVNSLRAPRIVFVLYVRKRGSQSHDFEPQRFSVKVFI